MKRSRIAVLAAACVLVTASLACGAVAGTDAPQPSDAAATLAPAVPATPLEPAPTDIPRMPVLEDGESTIRIIKGGDARTLYALKNETDQDEAFNPDTVRYTVDMPPDTQIDVGPGWCAKTAAIRDDNKKHFDPTVAINGKVIPDGQLEYFEWTTDDDMYCFSWDIVASDWPVGEHLVSEAFTFDESINDGWDDYPAGDYATEYIITVSEGAVTSSSDDECLSWDEVSVSMKGETVCFRGIITKFDQSRQLGTRYSFSDKSGTVFIYSIKYEIIDPNTGKTIAPGTCVEIAGPIRVEGDRPAIYLDPIMDDDSGESGYFNFYDDASSCP